MTTTLHTKRRRMAWFAAAALGLVVPTLHAGEAGFKAPTPLPPPRSMGSSDTGSEIIQADHRYSGTAVGRAPAFSGFGMAGAPKAGALPKAAAFPQPDVPPSVLPPLPPAGRVSAPIMDMPMRSTGSPVATAAASGPVPRTPEQFGTGWKNVINQKVLGREPAATILAPRSISGPRPEWGWHGYDNYNTGRPIAAPESTRAADAEMAQFQQYAHRWRPSTITNTYALMQANMREDSGSSAAYPAAMPITPTPAPLPSTVTPIAAPSPLTHSVLSEPATRDSSALTPSVTTPLPDLAPPMAPPTEFRAASLRTTDMPPPPPSRDPLPPLPALEAKPKVIYVAPPDFGGPNRLPSSIREKVYEVCAKRCRNLVVEKQSPVRLRIAFLAKDQIDAEMLTNQLAALPELVPYKVDFEVQIGQ